GLIPIKWRELTADADLNAEPFGKRIQGRNVHIGVLPERVKKPELIEHKRANAPKYKTPKAVYRPKPKQSIASTPLPASRPGITNPWADVPKLGDVCPRCRGELDNCLNPRCHMGFLQGDDDASGAGIEMSRFPA